ncbi:MAG: hypothetical protein R3B12_00365 [Candidatus Saccharimonadales bacterium]
MIVTPNIDVSIDQIIALAINFGKEQPETTVVSGSIMDDSHTDQDGQDMALVT